MELNTARGRLFAFIALIVSLPLLNHNFHFITSAGLEGVSPKTAEVPFSPENWWNGSYQEQCNTQINDSIAFRPDLVRLTNQLDYWLFHKVNAEKVILGYDGQLFGRMYIEEYNTVNPIPDSTIRRTCNRIKKLQDTLDKLGKTFIMAYSPSKPYVFPSKIPLYLRRHGSRASNYHLFRHYEDSLGIRQLDFNEWFSKITDTSRYPLMPRMGIHWSHYGSALAADSLGKFIERERRMRMPRLTIKEMTITDVPRDPDADLGGIMNLVYPMTREKLAYPFFVFNDTGVARKPKIIFVGDSYIWLWMGTGVANGMSDGWEFWEHFTDVWNSKIISGEEPVKHIETYNWQASLADADCIVLMFNATNYKELLLHSNFLESAYRHYFPHDK